MFQGGAACIVDQVATAPFHRPMAASLERSVCEAGLEVSISAGAGPRKAVWFDVLRS